MLAMTSVIVDYVCF